MDILTHLFLSSFLIFGIHVLFRDNMILDQLRTNTFDHLPDLITKPLIGCPACMASLWGTFYYISFISNAWPEWIMFCVMLSGLNWIINGLITPW